MAPAFTISVPAATAILDYDLLQGQPIRTSDEDRIVTGLGMMGSFAAGDTIADLMVGMSREQREYNRTTGFPNMDDVKPLEVAVPAGSPLTMPVIDAPATNSINAIIIIEEV